MQIHNNREPLFYNKDQTILKYGHNGNSFKISSLSEYYRPVDSSGLAVKFVVEGNERYTINKRSYAISSGSYLLLNGEKDATVEIESKKNVKGICIHISDEVIADAAASLMRPDTAYTDPDLATYLSTDLFLENKYQARHTALGKKLNEISGSIQHYLFSLEDINSGLFFELAEQLIADQTAVFKELQSIPTVKPVTRKDLYRRLHTGKEYIDANFTQSLTIEQIAKESAMSEYHFFRLFKMVFGKSPHQYIIERRLAEASAHLKERRTVSEAAIESGFSDIFTFSKAFKKHYGMPPSVYGNLK